MCLTVKIRIFASLFGITETNAYLTKKYFHNNNINKRSEFIAAMTQQSINFEKRLSQIENLIESRNHYLELLAKLMITNASFVLKYGMLCRKLVFIVYLVETVLLYVTLKHLVTISHIIFNIEFHNQYKSYDLNLSIF